MVVIVVPSEYYVFGLKSESPYTHRASWERLSRNLSVRVRGVPSWVCSEAGRGGVAG